MALEGNIIAPYDPNGLEFLDNLPGYDSSVGVIEQLELLKQIQESGAYYWQGISFPHSDQLSVAGGNSVDGTIQLVPGSWVTSIQVYNDYTTNPNGFLLNIYDKGSKASLFYGDYTLDRMAGSSMQLFAGMSDTTTPSDPGSNSDTPFGPGYRMSPFIITKPGVLGWEITNAGTSTAIMQVMLCVAVPINAKSIGQKLIVRS